MDRERFQIAIFLSYILLCLTGLVMVFSASCVMGDELFGSPYHFLLRQAIFLILSIAMALVILKYLDIRALEDSIPLLLILAIAILILPLLPHVGHRVGGAKRWIRLGSISIQPSELSKLIYIIYLSHYVSRRRKERIAPPLVVLAVISVLLSLEPDVGSIVFLSILTFLMLIAGGFDLRKLGVPAVAFGIVALILIKFSSYRSARIVAFLSPWEYSRTHGYQLVQAFISLGSGGILGKGLGSGTEKLFYLPEPHTDFIFAVIGEELGFVGVMFVVSLFFTLFLSGIKLYKTCKTPFNKNLILGLTLMITIQALIHMGVNLGLLPPKGMTLPFISYGGSSLVSSSMAIGMILKASDYG